MITRPAVTGDRVKSAVISAVTSAAIWEVMKCCARLASKFSLIAVIILSMAGMTHLKTMSSGDIPLARAPCTTLSACSRSVSNTAW